VQCIFVAVLSRRYADQTRTCGSEGRLHS
jgi:hypothetical protein